MRCPPEGFFNDKTINSLLLLIRLALTICIKTKGKSFIRFAGKAIHLLPQEKALNGASRTSPPNEVKLNTPINQNLNGKLGFIGVLRIPVRERGGIWGPPLRELPSSIASLQNYLITSQMV